MFLGPLRIVIMAVLHTEHVMLWFMEMAAAAALINLSAGTQEILPVSMVQQSTLMF